MSCCFCSHYWSSSGGWWSFLSPEAPSGRFLARMRAPGIGLPRVAVPNLEAQCMNPQVQRQDTPTTSSASTAIDPATQMGLVALAVADLDRSVTYYRDALGFAVLERDEHKTTLGAG